MTRTNVHLEKWNGLEIPQNVKQMIEDYEFFISALEEKSEELSVTEDDEEISEIKSDIEKIKKSIKMVDAKINDEMLKVQSKAKEEKKVEDVKPEVKTEVKTETQVEEESSGGGLGWFLLGAVVLVASAGAINMMKNR